jgi:hypothetical protein
MTTVFISGSMGIKNLDQKIKERIDNIINSGFAVIVGDADGADTAIQSYLSVANTANVTVYCSGSAARNNIGCWPIKSIETKHQEGSRAFFTAKDLAMADTADYGLMLWDSKSTGTLSNVIELLAREKKSLVYVNKSKSFFPVSTIDQFESLIRIMSEFSRKKADQKIGFSKRISTLKNQDNQTKMFA